jgi:hypothetical protein
MLRFEWNALRVGDRVLVHDTTTASGALVLGTVAMVNTQKDSYGVGIRIARAGVCQLVVWPSPLVVHRGPHDSDEPCWRCQTVMVGAA